MKFRIFPLLLTLAAVSCAGTEEEAGTRPAAETRRVTIGSGPRLDVVSRTTLGPDGRVDWTPGDKIALWAFDEAGAAQLERRTFELWHYNETYDEAKFTADVPAMSEGTYTYCATYPEPAAVDGTLVGYDIPAVQDGTYRAECDIMTARCTGPALQEGDNSDRVRLAFAHRIHLLKITVPSSQLGDKASRIELEFPQPVVGRLTFDAGDPDAEPVLTGGTSRLTLRFAEPIDAGATVYAAIAPVAIPAEGTVSIRTFAATGESRTDTFAGRTFAAGHTTPIEYNIPEMEIRYTIVNFRYADNGSSTLGEPVNSFTFTAPEGSTFDNGERSRVFARTDDNCYTMVFKEFTDNLSGRAITVTYDSEHAVVSNSFTMPQLVAETTNDVATLDIPYLFEEDFSSLTTSAGSDDNPGVGGTSVVDGNRTGVDLSQWGLSTSGWTAARVGVQAGGSSNGAVRICARVENQSFKSNTYNARIDSAPFDCIKPEAAGIQVRVTYNYKGGRYSIVRKNAFGGDGGSGNGNAVYTHGYTTVQGWQGGSIAIPNVVDGTMTIPGTAGSDRNKNQNYDNISLENSFVIPSATPATRASWSVSSTMSDAPFSGANGNFWLYLDNIRVSIVTE